MKKNLLYYRFYGLTTKAICCLLLGPALLSPAFAGNTISEITAHVQLLTIKGKINDDKGIPMPGVTVTNTTQKKSVSSNGAGEFSISADKGDVIVFRMIGYEEKSIIANDQTNVIVVLSEKSIMLENTVVTALGIRREERSLGYSISEVDGDGLKRAREVNVINSLAGKFRD